MPVAQLDLRSELRPPRLRVGSGVAVVINLALLIITDNLLDWGWLPFLTGEFAELVPWISVSLMLSIVTNLFYLFEDRLEVRAVGQILVNLVSIVVTYRILLVFPFDFDGYAFAWEVIARIALVLAIVGAGIGILFESIRLGTGGYTHAKEVTRGFIRNAQR